MNCPFCGIVLESNQGEGIMFAHPVTGRRNPCPMGGDYHHVTIWEKLADSLRFHITTTRPMGEIRKAS